MWKDISTYSRSDTDRTPRTWQCHAGGLNIAVTRHIHYPGDWLLQCVPWFDNYVLKSKDIDAAKAEALALVRRQVEIVLNDLP